ncbi:MAG TPA: rhomboid family intramembrane serine protease [Candidatus Dormibacteraeota bacterium]|nr:rhomboid family intramembrane serine protease [Candidatus Dormibacteraeota bacterium]
MPPFSFKKICQWCAQHEAAQRGEIVDDEKQRVIPPPWVRRSESSITLTQVIFGANIAIFLAMAIASGSPMDFPIEIERHFGANYGLYTLTGDWWRLLTYMFLHGGAMHIFFNMWCLWDLGRLCESLYGRWTYAAIYVITGVTGGLASVGWNPGVTSVGASGAIFGLAGALIASFYLGEFSLPRVAISGTLRSLVIFAVFNLFIGQVVGGIDNACHIGGLVGGLALGAVIARLAPQHDAPLRRATVVGFVAVAVLACGLGVREWRGRPMRMYRQYQAMGERGDAIGQLQAIVRQQPNLLQAHFALAQAYFNRQQFPQAEAEFKRILELKPNNVDARFYLGITYFNEKRPEEAKATFTQLVSQGASDGHYGMGLVLADQQNYQGAIEEFKKTVAAGTQISGVYYEMGNAYAKLKMYDDAIASYLKSKEKDGDDPDLENALADTYQAKGMAQQAQDARNRAAELKGGASGH